MSETIRRKSIALDVYSVVQTVVNFKPTNIETLNTIQGVIVPAKPKDLQGIKQLFGLQYYKVHALSKITTKDILEYKEVRCKAISVSDYSDYGFYKVIFEEIKA